MDVQITDFGDFIHKIELRGIEFVSFYEFTIGEVMYCICVLGDISFIYYWRSHVLCMCVR
jgi:hypothetical protein